MSFNISFRKKGQMVENDVDSLSWKGNKYVPESGSFTARFPVICGGRKAIRNFREEHPEFRGGFITFLEFGTVMELTVPKLPEGLIPDNSREIHEKKVETQKQEKRLLEKEAVENAILFMEEQDDPFWQGIAKKARTVQVDVDWCTLYRDHTIKDVYWKIPEYDYVFWSDGIDTIRVIPDMKNPEPIDLKFKMKVKYENPYCKV